MEKTLKIVSLISYSFIIVMGQMIGLPFLVWLIFTSFDFGNADQLFAILGIIGVSLMFTNLFKNRLIKILSFLLMITPLIRRLIEIPIEKFNYMSFQIPLFLFILSAIILIFIPNKE